jgi:hypothetical protein
VVGCSCRSTFGLTNPAIAATAAGGRRCSGFGLMPQNQFWLLLLSLFTYLRLGCTSASLGDRVLTVL